jgi:hypothetical protein
MTIQTNEVEPVEISCEDGTGITKKHAVLRRKPE